MFDAETIAFLRDLRDHNDRDWFNENRARYEAHWKAPATAFCDAMPKALAPAYGGAVTAKLFRINRDVRFSKDKTPYNAHIRMAFYSDGRGDMGWMIGLVPERLTLGYGLFRFNPAQLGTWLGAVDGSAGADLAAILDEGQAAGLRLDPPALKRVPAPYGKDHPRGDLLRRKGMALWHDGLPPEAAFGPEAVPRLTEELGRFERLRKWLAATLPE